jgi:chromosome segregation ATPase
MNIDNINTNLQIQIDILKTENLAYLSLINDLKQDISNLNMNIDCKNKEINEMNIKLEELNIKLNELNININTNKSLFTKLFTWN